MKKIYMQFAPSFYGLSGIFFLFSAARDVFSLELIIELCMFLLLGFGVFLALSLKYVWLAFFSYILILFYNPLILSSLTSKNTWIGDVVIGLSFFFIGLYISKKI